MASFKAMVDHLSVRGLATRKSWEGKCAVYYGMDNTSWIGGLKNKKGMKARLYTLCLADIEAKDWVKLPYNYLDNEIEGKKKDCPFDIR